MDKGHGPPLYAVGENFQRRGPNQVGFMSSSITRALPYLARLCCIYEWGVKRPLLGETKMRVVYVGSTCRVKRERSRLPSKGWSKWAKAMVPPLYAVGENFQRRGPNQVGFMSSSITRALPYLARLCCIYEWGVKRPLLGETKMRVVYVGSTCRVKPGASRDRI